MKKRSVLFVAMVLMLAMVLSLTACGKKKENEKSDGFGTSSQTESNMDKDSADGGQDLDADGESGTEEDGTESGGAALGCRDAEPELINPDFTDRTTLAFMNCDGRKTKGTDVMTIDFKDDYVDQISVANGYFNIEPEQTGYFSIAAFTGDEIACAYQITDEWMMQICLSDPADVEKEYFDDTYNAERAELVRTLERPNGTVELKKYTDDGYQGIVIPNGGSEPVWFKLSYTWYDFSTEENDDQLEILFDFLENRVRNYNLSAPFDLSSAKDTAGNSVDLTPYGFYNDFIAKGFAKEFGINVRNAANLRHTYHGNGYTFCINEEDVIEVTADEVRENTTIPEEEPVDFMGYQVYYDKGMFLAGDRYLIIRGMEGAPRQVRNSEEYLDYYEKTFFSK